MKSEEVIKILESRIKVHRKYLNHIKKHPKMYGNSTLLEMNYSYIYHELKFIIKQIKAEESKG